MTIQGEMPTFKEQQYMPSPGNVTCSICLDAVESAGDRATARLKCGHHFHLDCIGSAFNAKGAMQCPNCRQVEGGQWLFASGCYLQQHLLSNTNADEDSNDNSDMNFYQYVERFLGPEDSNDNSEMDNILEQYFEQLGFEDSNDNSEMDNMLERYLEQYVNRRPPLGLFRQTLMESSEILPWDFISDRMERPPTPLIDSAHVSGTYARSSQPMLMQRLMTQTEDLHVAFFDKSSWRAVASHEVRPRWLPIEWPPKIVVMHRPPRHGNVLPDVYHMFEGPMSRQRMEEDGHFFPYETTAGWISDQRYEKIRGVVNEGIAFNLQLVREFLAREFRVQGPQEHLLFLDVRFALPGGDTGNTRRVGTYTSRNLIGHEWSSIHLQDPSHCSFVNGYSNQVHHLQSLSRAMNLQASAWG